MWKKWTGLIWGVSFAIPCAISLQLPGTHALPFAVTILVMGIIIPNVDLGMNRLTQGAVIGVLLGLPMAISFGWWPLFAIAAANGLGISWVHERFAPLLLRKKQPSISLPVFRLRTLFVAMAIVALLLAWRHHATSVRNRLRREGISLYQHWYELRPNNVTVNVQSTKSGVYRINGQEYDDQQAVTFLIETLERLRQSGIAKTELQLNSKTIDRYEENRIWVLQHCLEAHGVTAQISFTKP
jgi:hypothetical protein